VTMRVVEFHFRGPASRRLFLSLSLAALPPFAFAVQAVVRWPGGIRIGACRLVTDLGLVLCQPLGQATDLRVQALVVGAQALVVGLDFRQAPLQFGKTSIVLASVHTGSLANVALVSCASSPDFLEKMPPV